MTDNQIAKLRKTLLTWGEANIKTYPWRQTRDPYLILVAEFMLHRTQVPQAQAVYQHFTGLYPKLC